MIRMAFGLLLVALSPVALSLGPLSFGTALAADAKQAENASGPENAAGIVEVVSPSGIRAWLRQDKSIPLLAIDFQFAGGSLLVPPQKAGAATLAATMLNEGAGNRDAEAFRRVLADNSISIGFSAGRESLSGSLVALVEHQDLAVSLLRDALVAPRLDAVAFERQRAGMITAARRRLKSPNSIAYREWRETAFAGHPYVVGTAGTEETLPTITVQDLRDFLGKAISRKSLIVGVAGDIEPVALGLLLDKAFSELPSHDAPPPTPQLGVIPSGLSVIPFPAGQSVIVFGHGGIKRNDPDWQVALVVSQILGGGTFTSRLGLEVREKRGLAYGIGVGLSPSAAGGTMLGRTATRNEAVKEVLQIIADEWRRLADEGPTAKEVDDAKAYLIGSFPLSLDSTGAIAGTLVQMQFYDLGRSYWTERPALFEAVTVDVAKRVAKRILDVDGLLTVVVGQPAGVTSSP
ncbi:MAG: M16 family metallopeptidase [Alphaproteobacteria bacterium]